MSHDQAVGAVLRGVIDQHLAELRRAVGGQVVGQQRHAALARRGASLGSRPMPGRAVVVADDVERLLVGRDAHAVRLAGVGDDAVDRAVGVDAVDGLHRLVDRLVAEVARIAEVDAALLVDGDVVGRVERPALEQAGDDVALAGLHVGA